MSAGHALRTASIVRTHRALASKRAPGGRFQPGHAVRNVGRIPRPAPPLAIEAAHARAIIALITPIRDRLLEQLAAELADQLPQERADSYFLSGQLDSTDVAELAAAAAEVRAKRRRQVFGLTVWIENDEGDVREWVDSDGERGRTVMRFPYGFIDGVLGADGEPLDVYLGPMTSVPDEVYVVAQMSKSSGFTEYDEDKVMLGFASERDAKDAYLAQYDDPRFLGGIRAVPFAAFVAGLENAGAHVVRLDRVEHRGDKWVVLTEDGTHVLGTHDTEAEADAQLRAVDASERARMVDRFDAADARRAKMLIDRAKKQMTDALNVGKLEQLGRQTAQATTDFQRQQLAKQTKSALAVDIKTPDSSVPRLQNKFVKENVKKIQSLGGQSLDRVERLVVDAFDRGRRAEDVAKDIKAGYGVDDRKAMLIARNEIGTLNAQVAAARQQELGVTRFTWRTMEDERVRDLHAEVDGEVFEYTDPPAVGVYGDPVLPGEDINCRCYAEPVFEDIFDDPEAAVANAEAARAENQSGDDGEDVAPTDEEDVAPEVPVELPELVPQTPDDGSTLEVAQRPDENAAAFAARLKRNEASRLAKQRARSVAATALPAHTPPSAPPAPLPQVTPIAAPAPQPIAAAPTTTAIATAAKPGETPQQHAARLARNEASRNAKAAARAAARGGTVPAAKPITAPAPPPSVVTHIPAPAPQPIATLAPAPATARPGAPIKPGESPAQHAARLARNEASRLSKAAARAAKGQAAPQAPALPPAASLPPPPTFSAPARPVATAGKPRGPGPTGGSAPVLPPEPTVSLPPHELARVPAPDELAAMSRAELIARAKYRDGALSLRPGDGPESGQIKSSWDMTPEERANLRAFQEKADAAKAQRNAEISAAPIQFVPVPDSGPRIDRTVAKKLDVLSPLASDRTKLAPKQQAAARDYLRSAIDQYGFSLRDPTTGQGAKLKVIARYRNRGSHSSDGDINIQGEVARNAGLFAKDMASGVDYKATFDAKRSRGYLMDQQEARKIQDYSTRANDYRTFVHEQVHGYGPRDRASRSYSGSGVLVEEVATETTARKIVRDQLGIQHGDVEALSRPVHAGSFGSYTREIVTASDAVQGAIGEVAGHVSSEHAYDVLERTSLRYKTLDAHPLADTPEGSVKLFARSIDHDEIEKKVGRKLTSDERARIEAGVEKRLNSRRY